MQPLVCYDDALQTLFLPSDYAADSARWLICPNGEFLFELAPFANGMATFNISLSDNGGVERGGVDSSPNQVLTVKVEAVNSKPSFSLQNEVEALEDSGNQTRDAVATLIVRGPDDEDAQMVTFSSVLLPGSDALFVPRRWVCPGAEGSEVPSLTLITICADGRLMFEVAANMVGSAAFDVRMQDSGGRLRGGLDMSSVHVLNMTVVSVNDAPSFKLVSVIQVWESTGTHVIKAAAFDISSGSSEESMQSLSFNVSLHSGSTSLFVAEGQAGAWSMNVSGALTFAVQAFASGNATLRVSLSDSGGTANAGQNVSDQHLVRIEVLSRNNAPTFQVQDTVNVLEDQGNIALTNFVHTILKNGDNNAAEDDELSQKCPFLCLYRMDPICWSGCTMCLMIGLLWTRGLARLGYCISMSRTLYP